MTKKKYTYPATAYRQSRDPSAPWLISFVAPADELLRWAGIPRRSENIQVGFQRTYDEVRADKAKKFFNLGTNQSPTSLVVGLHPFVPGDLQSITLEPFSGSDGISEDDNSPNIRRRNLVVCVDPTIESVTEAVQADLVASLPRESVDLVVNLVRAQIEYRLQSAEASLAESGAQAEGTSEQTDNDEIPEATYIDDFDLEHADDEDSAEPYDHYDDDIELGRSLLRNLLDLLDDHQWCLNNLDALCDLAKPATLIDGQHRAKAAQLCERELPFAVCAIVDCQWPEQVFQFTVVNYTAKGIPDQFITANAALSLTKPELDQLQDRLVQAGVKVIEYELMRVVNFDDESPFFQRVNLTERKQADKIGYKTMVRIARKWYKADHPVLKNMMLPNLYPDLEGKRAKSARQERWKEGDWGRFFLAFWNVVHKQYCSVLSQDGHTLWDVGHSNLLIAIVLYELQEAFLRNLNAQDEEFFQVSAGNPVEILLNKTTVRAEKFVSYIPPEFFSRTWKLKSLSIGPGREALAGAFRNLVDTKGKYSFGNSPVITGNVS